MTPQPTTTTGPFSYAEAVERLLQLGHEGRALKWDLVSIRHMLERLGHPERRFPIIHIAGTNGKGSVATLVESILRQAGIRTGLYTSPHLCRINERVRVDGQLINDNDFAVAFGQVNTVIESLLTDGSLPHNPSYFETLTALALHHFVQAKAEAVVLEAGLGGRLDSTNAVQPIITAITAVDFDHERWLGHSLEQISQEKAGILKPGVPIINAADNPIAHAIIAQRAAEVGAPMIDPTDYHIEDVEAEDLGRYSFTLNATLNATLKTSRPSTPLADDRSLRLSLRFSLGLRGRHQIRNALTAIAITRELACQGWDISRTNMVEGVQQARWPGRLHLLRPTQGPAILLDGAHNPGAARALRDYWQDCLAGRRVHLLYGTLREKAVEEIAEILFPQAASVMLTQTPSERGLSLRTLRLVTEGLHPHIEAIAQPAEALRHLRRQAAPEDIVLVAGSLYLVGACLQDLTEHTTLDESAGQIN